MSVVSIEALPGLVAGGTLAGLDLGDTIIAATSGTAATVGNAVGLAVAAPISIVDQNTRENLGSHVESSIPIVPHRPGAPSPSRACNGRTPGPNCNR